ncbi:MAG: glycoside hydrolase family 127 protein, partial [bacterium]|nr:glycoside hydrolase family 127 protein [Candidatus Colisoma equi]
MRRIKLVWVGMFCASAAVCGPADCAAQNSGGGGVRPSAMRTLPLGSIRPEGHLRERLERQARGLTGHAEELYRDIGESDWLTNAGVGKEYSWERGPYYARGLVALAFTLGDEMLKARARKWVEAALAAQKESGDFGPRKDNWWANMIPQWYLRDWADATGDPRVVPFLERYYSYQMKEFETFPLEKEGCWACARGGDEIDAILWLYGKTGDGKWIDFARRIAGMTADWTTYYRVGGEPGFNAPRCGGYRCHIVNFMQGLKFPAMKWLLGGDEADRNAYAAAFDPNGWVMCKCGRPDGMINGSEPLTDRSASGGTELCAIAERIISIQKTVA